ncbi:hypothetical protein [Natrialbaceae archaeon AArc-T1-2]|uniref:hypothetical protein n=1 Tax=Natrialbaceae archaeon AArc-T1-2 TaxID=3053904 RepID=UPI00255B0586|nr:hypothetical protein [Natrialbaceae archaeon AArc-T1-2]WIV68026.1 hypothetical protein QQ977_04660 [Natrialbaceae archaeon AArc-T1-2]
MAYRFECPRENCPFVLRSAGDDEVEKLGRAHVRLAHRDHIAPVDLERRIERVDTV